VDKRKLRKILTRLRSMQKTLDSLIEQVTAELEENNFTGKASSPKQPETELDVQALREEWEALQQALLTSKNPETIAREFIQNKTKPYLRQLFRVNHVPIDSRASKAEQLRQLLQLIRVSKTIQSGKPQ